MNALTKILLIWMMAIHMLAENRKMIDNKPDFRYPLTVSQNALNEYGKAIKVKDYNLALQSVIQYALAETSRTDSAMTDVMSKCETLYQLCDKVDLRVIMDHLRTRLCIAYANHHYLDRDMYLQQARKYHKNAILLAEGLKTPARQLGENLLRADEWGWRIIPTLSDYLKQWEYEYFRDQGEPTDYLRSWRNQQTDRATEMYLEYKLVEMQSENQYAAYKRYEATYPDSPYLASCRNRIAEMEREDVRMVYSNESSSRTEIEVRVSVDNLKDLTLTMYRMPEDMVKGENNTYDVKNLQPVAKTEVHIDGGAIPFYGKDTIAKFAPQAYGKYVILPSFTDKYGKICTKNKITLNRWENQIMTVTDLAAYVMKEGKEYTVVTVDRTTGAPLKDVKVERIENTYRLTRGADRYSDPVSVYESNYSLPKARNEVSIYTDLKIYRPGETLRGTVIAFQCDVKKRKPLAGKACTITLQDANRKEVSRQTSTLDEMGQATFSMDIPTDRMNGQWSLSCETEGDDSHGARGYAWVEVSEYKLPTYSIDLSETPSEQPRGADGKVCGRAMTFTGMPVTDAEVELTLSRHTWWRWRWKHDTFSSKRLTVKTDAQGRFSFDCPAEWFTIDERDCYIYQAQVSCTSKAGERHDASCTFTVGKAESQETPDSETDQTSEPDKLMWIPQQSQRVSKDGRTTDILIGVREECYIYYVVESRTRVEKVKSHWLHYKPGMHHLRLPMPKGSDNYLNIQLATMRDGQTCTETVHVESPRKERLQLVAMTFRDKCRPGQGETWRFRVTDQDGRPVKAARLMLEAYNKALKRLAQNPWRMNASYLTASLCDLQTMGTGDYYTSLSGTLSPLQETLPMLPQLWLYGEDFFGSGRVMMGNRMFAAMASPAMKKNLMAMEDGAVMAESAAAEEEVADEDVAVTEIRSGDIHVALWEPRLTSDKDGNVEVMFEVPQHNATWVVQALAYSSSMSIGQWDAEVQVKRPLMVQPMLPRFVRQGDHAVLKAQVMNATDSLQQAHVMLELFDPRTNATILAETTDIQLQAKGTQVVQIACNVPNDAPYIGLRIMATAPDGSSDGEQQMLPVASNAQPVVETCPFYLQPDQPAFDKVLEAPNGKNPDRLILEYSANPTWYCYKALPSMIDEEARTSIAMAHSLFAIILADRIKNDSATHQAQYDKFTDRLQSLQKQDGGFAWIDYENCTSSEWATGTVLELIGELYHLGCLTDDSRLMQMARKGIAYMERNAIERAAQLAEARSKDYSGFLSFAYIRNLFSKACLVADPKVQEVLDKTIASLAKTWGRFSLRDKAFVALTLNRMGRADVAREVVESLRQFAISTPAKGMYWERLQDGFWYHPVAATSVILQAMAEVDPRTDELNRIRQWLLLEKQTSDWGNSSLTSDAVYALLTTGDDWLSGDDEGYTSEELPVDTRTIHIDHKMGTPAWGAIYWEYVAPVTEIRAVSLPEVSISKSLMVQDADGKWVPATTLSVGQRVQVRLDVHADKALEYVTINDGRPAMLEPMDQTSHYEWSMGDGYFQETKDRQTILYIHRLRAGDHRFTYECNVTHKGTFAAGIATIQSQYAPQYTAHTAGVSIETH